MKKKARVILWFWCYKPALWLWESYSAFLGLGFLFDGMRWLDKECGWGISWQLGNDGAVPSQGDSRPSLGFCLRVRIVLHAWDLRRKGSGEDTVREGGSVSWIHIRSSGHLWGSISIEGENKRKLLRQQQVNFDLTGSISWVRDYQAKGKDGERWTTHSPWEREAWLSLLLNSGGGVGGI